MPASRQAGGIDEAVVASFPLPAPIALGTTVMTEREFAFVRITTHAGLEGAAFVLSRSQPIVEAIQYGLAPLIVGRDADAIARRVQECHEGTVAPARPGLHTRALSLLEIALWDIKARRADLPLWRLLGGYRPDHPGLIVAEYPNSGSDLQAIGEQIGRHGQDGFGLVKIKRCDTPEQTRELLAASRAALPEHCEIVVDAGWIWRNAADAVREIRDWGDIGLAWLEDPFPAGDVRSAVRLRDSGVARIGSGDEVADPRQLERLVEADAVDVLRVDATSLGGIQAFRNAMTLAMAAGLEISPHAYPEIHVHCAAAWPGVRAVETFQAASATFPSHLFITGGPVIRDGMVHAPSTPGLGFELDWDHIHHRARREANVT
jgi:L-alanine-DL-glutamate epimerase-like enolase superfamily enzyme